jgi:intein/homing endonuclease
MYNKLSKKKWKFNLGGGLPTQGIDGVTNPTFEELQAQMKLYEQQMQWRTQQADNQQTTQQNLQLINNLNSNLNTTTSQQTTVTDPISTSTVNAASATSVPETITNATDTGTIADTASGSDTAAAAGSSGAEGVAASTGSMFSSQDYVKGAMTGITSLQNAKLDDGKITADEVGSSALDAATGMAGPYGQVANAAITVGENLLGDSLYQGLGEGVEYEKGASRAGKGALKGAAVGMKVGGPWGCVCKGSRILINSGEFKNVEDLKIEDGVIGFDGQNYIPQEIIGFHPPTKKECIEFETTLGQTLRCSIDHPIYSRKAGRAPRVILNGKRTRIKKYNYVEAQYLEIGDSVGILNSFDIWGSKKMDRAYIVGMCIGDGSYGKNKGIRLHSADEDTWEYLETNKLGVPGKPRFLFETSKELRTYTIIDGCPLFRELGIYAQTKLNKRLPINIQDYDKESICTMLAGLFDSDGYVCFNPEKPKNGRIAFCQSNIDLINQVKEQLIKLGVHCYLKIEKAHKQEINGRLCNIREGYCLIIKDKSSVINFYNNISLNIKYKKQNLEDFYKYKLTCNGRDNKNINNICAAKITKITNIGEQDIYNLEAGGSHTYIANTIITHNSAIGAVAGAALGFAGQARRKRAAMKEFEKRRDERIRNMNQQSKNIYADQHQSFYKKGGKAIIKIKEANKGLFTKHCIGQGYTGVTQKCIDQAKKSNYKSLRKQAIFAENVRSFKK